MDTNHPYTVYVMYGDEKSDICLGGSYDQPSAVAIACALFTTLYQPGHAPSDGLAVFDSTNTLIAAITSNTVAASGPAPLE